MEKGFLAILQQGGFAIYPLVICSILGVAIVIERIYFLLKAQKTVKELHPQFIRLIQSNHVAEAESLAENSFLGKIYQKAFGLIGHSEEQIQKSLERTRIEQIQFLRNRVWILGTIGSLAPFIGLFGTVVGIMHAFAEIARTQEGGFTTVSAGISEALIATAAGIFVGVLAVTAYNAFSNLINQVGFQLKAITEDLAQLLGDKPVKQEATSSRRK